MRLLPAGALAVLAATTLSVSAAGAAAVRPIPRGPAFAPAFIGAPATANPVTDVAPVPQNPFLAPNGDSGIHDDGWQTNTYDRPGPLGHNPRTISNFLLADCGSIAFDRAGRIVATCIGVSTTALYLMDPATLAVLGKYRLPGRSLASVIDNPNIFQGFGGGGYFYLDSLDRAVIGTSTGHVLVIAENASATGFTLVHDYNLNGVLTTGETLNSALPDSNGLLWFVTKRDGVVGTLNGPEVVARDRARLRVHEDAGRDRPLVLDRARLPDRPGRLALACRDRHRLQQQLRRHHPRPGRHGLSRHARRHHRYARPVTLVGWSNRAGWTSSG